MHALTKSIQQEANKLLGLCFNMGACMSGEAAGSNASRNIEKLMTNAYAMESEKVKLLLLGAGESGKSTIFKQMRILFGAPLTEEEKNQITPVVYNNTIASMKLLVQAVIDMGYENDVSINCSCQHDDWSIFHSK